MATYLVHTQDFTAPGDPHTTTTVEADGTDEALALVAGIDVETASKYATLSGHGCYGFESRSMGQLLRDYWIELDLPKVVS